MVNELPPIVVVLLTYKRTEYALKTIEAAAQHLKYHNLQWYVADDGSEPEHFNAVRDALQSLDREPFASHSAKLGYGGSANRAWDVSTEVTPLTFWLEDDWLLSKELDLTPFAKALMSYETVGMIRLGHLNQYMRGTCLAYGDRLYWRLDREADDGASPVFTGHPSLRHIRYRSAYGSYPRGHNPGDTELYYAYNFRIAEDGPDILWPAEAGQWGWFGHIGEVKSYE